MCKLFTVGQISKTKLLFHQRETIQAFRTVVPNLCGWGAGEGELSHTNGSLATCNLCKQWSGMHTRTQSRTFTSWAACMCTHTPACCSHKLSSMCAGVRQSATCAVRFQIGYGAVVGLSPGLEGPWFRRLASNGSKKLYTGGKILCFCTIHANEF